MLGESRQREGEGLPSQALSQPPDLAPSHGGTPLKLSGVGPLGLQDLRVTFVISEYFVLYRNSE